MRVSLIVATDLDGLLGVHGDLPWGRSLPADLRCFRGLTLGHVVVMGRTTYASLGRPLAGRVNVVLSRDPAFTAPGCVVARSLDDALRVAEGVPEVFVIGGGTVYREALARGVCDRLCWTVVAHRFGVEGVAFPAVDLAAWRVAERETHVADDANRYATTFTIYERE